MSTTVETIRAHVDTFLRADPDILIYNAVGGSLPPRSEALSMSYGHFDLYPAVYPSVVPYPPFYEVKIEKNASTSPIVESLGLSTRLSCQYPTFDLCEFFMYACMQSLTMDLDPALYPSVVVYPSVQLAVAMETATEPSRSLRLESSYPNLVVYPPVYPVFDIYPACETKSITFNEEAPVDINVALTAHYPNLIIYPAVYPSMDIYPATRVDQSRVIGVQEVHLAAEARTPPRYPNLVIYPPVYPYFDVYPAITLPSPAEDRISTQARFEMAPIRLPAFYPSLDIYAPAYPFFDIYPAVSTSPAQQSIVPRFSYPNIIIYEPLRTHQSEKSETEAIIVRLPPSYPTFDLYPAGYPHLVIYPDCAAVDKRKTLSISVRLAEGASRLYTTPLSPRRNRRTSDLRVLEPLRTQRHNRRGSNVRMGTCYYQ